MPHIPPLFASSPLGYLSNLFRGWVHPITGEVHDGDTLWITIDRGFGDTSYNLKGYRLVSMEGRGFNAYETNSPDDTIRAKAIEARGVMIDHCWGKHVAVVTFPPDPADKYGRWLAGVLAKPLDGTSYGTALRTITGYDLQAYTLVDMATYLESLGLGVWQTYTGPAERR